MAYVKLPGYLGQYGINDWASTGLMGWYMQQVYQYIMDYYLFTYEEAVQHMLNNYRVWVEDTGEGTIYMLTPLVEPPTGEEPVPFPVEPREPVPKPLY